MVSGFPWVRAMVWAARTPRKAGSIRSGWKLSPKATAVVRAPGAAFWFRGREGVPRASVRRVSSIRLSRQWRRRNSGSRDTQQRGFSGSR